MMNMELMEKKLNDACVEGDVKMLEALMREDKLILARISLSSCFNQTPLHLACMLGHFDFAKSLLSFKPDFASRLDSQGRSPLHLASANGYADIVGLLLLHDQKMCQVRDEDGRTPLHLAVMNGQQESVRELIKVNPESSYDQEATVLHLCVMYNRLNVLILILESGDQDLSYIKYDKGNTILHSAAALRRLEIIKHLVLSRSEDLDVNAVNENGLTALDIIEQMPKDVKTMEIKELLISAGTSRVTEITTETTTTTSHLIPARVASAVSDHNIEGAGRSKLVKMVKKFKKKSLFPKKQEKKDKNLMVAATVIAAMAYQAAISPPGGIAGLDAKEYNINYVPPSSPPSYYLLPTESLLAFMYSKLSNTFWITNTIAFIAALSVIFLYVSGASLKGRFFIWLIRLGMWITLSSMTLAYACAVSATTRTPEDYNKPGTTLFALVIAIVAWITLIFLAVLVLVFRIFYYVVRKIITITKRSNRKKKNTSEDGAGAATFTAPDTNVV